MDYKNLIGDIHIRIDRKQLINQLRALSDNYIQLHINSKDLSWLEVADRFNRNRMKTKN